MCPKNLWWKNLVYQNIFQWNDAAWLLIRRVLEIVQAVIIKYEPSSLPWLVSVCACPRWKSWRNKIYVRSVNKLGKRNLIKQVKWCFVVHICRTSFLCEDVKIPSHEQISAFWISMLCISCVTCRPFSTAIPLCPGWKMCALNRYHRLVVS